MGAEGGSRDQEGPLWGGGTQPEARVIIRKWPHADLGRSMQGQGPGAGESTVSLGRWFSKHNKKEPWGRPPRSELS